MLPEGLHFQILPGIETDFFAQLSLEKTKGIRVSFIKNISSSISHTHFFYQMK